MLSPNILYLYMIAFIIIFIAATVAMLDLTAYVKHISRWKSPCLRILATGMLIVSNLLPAFIIAANRFMHDNSSVSMSAGMWVFTVYLLLTLPRLAFYAGLLAARHKRLGRILGLVLGCTTFAIMLYGLLVTRTDLHVNEIRAEYPNLPQTFDGYRIVFFSDLHIGALLNAEKEIDSLVSRINGLDADLVVFGGDIVNIRYSELTTDVAYHLKKIRSTDGVVCVLGNHDTGVYIKDSISLPKAENRRRLCDSIEKMGWNLLRDSTIYVYRGKDSISVTGIDFKDRMLEYGHSPMTDVDYTPSAAYDGVPEHVFNITVSHLPQMWEKITALGRGDLTLSGHVHATQAKIEMGPVRLSPAMMLYKEWSGMYERSGKRLYINDGIGNVGFYMRIGAHPEITSIELLAR